jgi:hypothetical protein
MTKPQNNRIQSISPPTLSSSLFLQALPKSAFSALDGLHPSSSSLFIFTSVNWELGIGELDMEGVQGDMRGGDEMAGDQTRKCKRDGQCNNGRRSRGNPLISDVPNFDLSVPN